MGEDRHDSINANQTVTYILCSLQEPVPGRSSVGHGFLSGKCLTGNDEQGSLWVTLVQNLSDVGSIDVGDKVASQVPLGVRLQGFSHHDRAQVGSTDTNVDNVSNLFASVTSVLSRSNGFRKLLHVVQDFLDLISTLLLNLVLVIENVSEGNVQHSSVLRGVDVLSRKHGIPEFGYLGLPSEVEQGRPDLRGDQVLTVIEQDLVLLARRGRLIKTRECLKSLVILKELLENKSVSLLVIDFLELLPALVSWR